MIQMFYLLIFLGLIQSFCCYSGKVAIPDKTAECVITDISGNLQNHDAILEEEDFSPDFGSFCQVENPDLYNPYTDIPSDFTIKCNIYTRHFILSFISDLPPPCCFML
jgi:hypothetical protein